MSIKVNCYVKAKDNIQIEFDEIKDFYRFEKEMQPKEKDHVIKAYVKETNTQIAYMDEYKDGNWDWYVVNGKYLNYFEPLCFHSLEDYL